jgi:hypothetical protein
MSIAAPWRIYHLDRGEPETTAGRFLAMERSAETRLATQVSMFLMRCRVRLSRAFKAFEQQIDGLAHQLGTAGVLLVRQLIQQGQLALS